MNKYIVLAAVAALAACSETAEQPDPAETVAAAPEPAATEQGVAPGTYEVTRPDGSMDTTVITADGGYIETNAEGVETRGAYARTNGQDCFDPAGDEPEICWTVTEPGADGSFTATSPDGTEVTVTLRTEPAVSTTPVPTT